MSLVLLAAAFLGVRGAADRLQASLSAELTGGQRELQDGKGLLQAANTERSQTKLQQAQTHFQLAVGHFRAAEQIAGRSRLLGVAEAVPVLGGYARVRHDAARGIAQEGEALGQAGVTAAEIDRLLIAPNAPGTGGAQLIAVLNASRPRVDELRRHLEAAARAAAAVHSDVLPADQRTAFDAARRTVANGLAGVVEFQRLVPALVDILGGNGVRTYLVEQVNPAELRSGGGFIGTISILTADQGKLNLSFTGDTYVFDRATAAERPRAGQPGYVPPPVNYLSDFFTRTWSMEDSNFFPEFATNARWGEFFANHARGIQTQGVIAMDYHAVGAMLAVTGPVAVPEFGVTFNSTNFADEVFRRSLVRDPNHKSILAATAGPLIDKLSHLPADRWPKLAELLNGAVAGRHLQVFFNDAAVGAEMVRLGWSPYLNPAKANDFMLETEDSYGGTKTNHFIDRHFTVTLSRSNGLLHHKVTIDITDNAPPLPDGNSYSCYLRFYTPAQATNVRLSKVPSKDIWPVPSTERAGLDLPAGLQFAHTRFLIAAGKTARMQVTVEYDTPWATDASGNHEVYWQKQAGPLNDKVDIVWLDGDHTFRTTGTLSQDRIIKLTPTAVTLEPAQTATAHLPQLGF